MENKQVIFQKIPLEDFIDALVELFDNGADYVDIMGTANANQDVMSIIVRKEYINPECNGFQEEEEGEDGEHVSEIKTDEDLTELI